MVAGQFFGRIGYHFLPANDADVVGVFQLFRCGVGVPGVHVVNGSPGQYHIIEGLFEGPCCQVHGADCEERQCVNSDHDNNEKAIQDHFDQSDDKLCVQHKYSLVLPGILAKKTWKLI